MVREKVKRVVGGREKVKLGKIENNGVLLIANIVKVQEVQARVSQSIGI